MSVEEMESLLDARDAAILAIHRFLRIAGRAKSDVERLDEELNLCAAMDQAAARLDSKSANNEV